MNNNWKIMKTYKKARCRNLRKPAPVWRRVHSHKSASFKMISVKKSKQITNMMLKLIPKRSTNPCEKGIPKTMRNNIETYYKNCDKLSDIGSHLEYFVWPLHVFSPTCFSEALGVPYPLGPIIRFRPTLGYTWSGLLTCSEMLGAILLYMSKILKQHFDTSWNLHKQIASTTPSAKRARIKRRNIPKQSEEIKCLTKPRKSEDPNSL